jgi:hypothetical protein
MKEKKKLISIRGNNKNESFCSYFRLDFFE